MNALLFVTPYKHEGLWVFDDPTVGLVKEPFVFGIDTMLDRLTAEVPNAEKGFTLLFSPQPFPGYAADLDWRRESTGAIGTIARSTRLRAGFVPRFLNILSQRQRNFMRKQISASHSPPLQLK